MIVFTHFLLRMQQQRCNGAVKRWDFPRCLDSSLLSRGLSISSPSMLSWPSPGEKGTGGGGSERSLRHVHPSVFCPPSQLIGSCVRPPLPNPSSPLPRSSLYPFPFSHFYFSFHKSDRSSLRCAVTMATLHSAAGPHPLPLSSSPPSLPPSLFLSLSPIICSDSMVLNIDGGVLHPDPALFSSPLLFSASLPPFFLSHSPLFSC